MRLSLVCPYCWPSSVSGRTVLCVPIGASLSRVAGAPVGGRQAGQVGRPFGAFRGSGAERLDAGALVLAAQVVGGEGGPATVAGVEDPAPVATALEDADA